MHVGRDILARGSLYKRVRLAGGSTDRGFDWQGVRLAGHTLIGVVFLSIRTEVCRALTRDSPQLGNSQPSCLKTNITKHNQTFLSTQGSGVECQSLQPGPGKLSENYALCFLA